jgi:hypothetical protein
MLFDRNLVGFRNGGLPIGDSKTSERKGRNDLFHTATLLKSTGIE